MPEKMVTVRENSVNVGGSQEFHCVGMSDFLAALAGTWPTSPHMSPYLAHDC